MNSASRATRTRNQPIRSQQISCPQGSVASNVSMKYHRLYTGIAPGKSTELEKTLFILLKLNFHF